MSATVGSLLVQDARRGAVLTGDAHQFFEAVRLLLKLDEVLVPGRVVATQEAVEFRGALGGRHVAGLEGCARRALEDGVLHLVGEAENGGGGRAEGFVDDPPLVGSQGCRVSLAYRLRLKCILQVAEILGQFSTSTLGRAPRELPASSC